MEYSDTFSDQERRIIDEFLALMDEKSYSKISVKELTARCSIARTTFYRFFTDTYELLEAIERFLLDELILYRSNMRGEAPLPELQSFAGKPYESIERFFATGIRLRPQLRPIMGEYGDPYFKERLAKRLRIELDIMMGDEGAPNDELRPYYVATIASAYIGLLSHIASVEDSGLLDVGGIAFIANSMRIAYFRSDERAPAISDKRLFGEKHGKS